MTQKQALDILKTGANVFLTGEPGAGKTHTINEYVRYLRDHKVEVAITASTGIAATHIGGMTIHSWSGMGINTSPSNYELDAIASREYIVKRVGRAKILIIDEVSMLSSQALDTVDSICRAVRQSDLPFGGLQVILVGDFFQLPPISKSDEQAANFAYHAAAWQGANPIVCYLTEQHRQDDGDFLNLLSAIRRNEFNHEHMTLLENRKLTAGVGAPKDTPKIFSHNVDVDRVNTGILNQLPGEEKNFRMTTTGPQNMVAALQKGCLSPQALCLKKGAAVMFTKNNPKEQFVNGTLGIIEDFAPYTNQPVVKVRGGRSITVEPMDWTIEENGRVKARIMQMPLRLAWAITIHKSQGVSLDEAVVDLGEVFEFGQGYVALSRVRRLSGLHLVGWNERAFQVHPDILAKDAVFRQASTAAEHEFSHLPEADRAKMHNNFILASGGKLRPAKQTAPQQTSGMSYDKIREEHPNAYRPWDKGSDEKLQDLFKTGLSTSELMSVFGRKRGAIRARLIKLGLVQKS